MPTGCPVSGQGAGSAHSHGEGDVPLAGAAAANGRGLGPAFQGTLQDEFDASDVIAETRLRSASSVPPTGTWGQVRLS